MKFFKYYLLFILTYNYSFCQQQEKVFGEIAHFSNIVTPSPEASSITKYGDFEHDLYRGKASVNIPIYEIKTGDLNYPINMNYQGAGVKVDDFCSWTGINWTIDAVGVINRTVVDFPDETSGMRYYINKQHLTDNITDACAPYSQFYRNTCLPVNDYYDTQVDIFNFRFNGYSGSFFLNENYEPVYIEGEHNIKIEILGNLSSNYQNLNQNKEFLIITPDGVKYYFGKNEVESSRSFSGNMHNSIIEAPTAFYLYKIEHPVKGRIDLVYTNVGMTNYIHSKTDNITMPDAGAYVSIPAINSTNNGILVNDVRYLDKIVVDQENLEVVFNKSALSNPTSGSRFVLNSIEVKKDNVVINKILFDYFAKNSTNQQSNDFSTAKRFFLEKIEFHNESNISNSKKEIYKMEYDTPELLPARLSKSQDVLGYYNGKNNLSLIPKPLDDERYNSNSFGNRNPDFTKAKYGTLKKIIYPTGGFTNFNYEPSPGRQKVYSNICGSIFSVLTPPEEIESGEITNYCNSDPVFIQNVPETQKVKIKLHAGGDENASISSGFRVKIEDITPDSNILPEEFGLIIGHDRIADLEVEYFFKIGHSYKILVSLNGSNGDFGGTYSFKLFTHYEKVDGLGVRLKEQINYNNINELAETKVFYYSPINNINDSNPNHFRELTFFPSVKYFLKESNTPTGNGDNDPMSYDSNFGYYMNLYYDSSFYKNEDINPTVSISYGGANFENGGIEKNFLSESSNLLEEFPTNNDGCWIDPVSNEQQCGAPVCINAAGLKVYFCKIRETTRSNETDNNDIFNGKLVNERIYKKSGNELAKIKETIYDYDINIRNDYATNFVGYQLYRELVPNYCPTTGAQVYSISSCYRGCYDTKTYNFKLNSTKKIDYIEPISLNYYYPYVISIDDDNITNNINYENSRKKIVNTQDFEYGTLRGLPTVVTTNTSDSAIVNKTVNTYVNTASSLADIPSNQSALYSSLISQNQVGTPIQTQQFQNAELLSTQRTLYNNFTVNNVTKILPEKIQIGKGDLTVNPLEDKAIFYNYDEHFNPVVMGYKDAPKTRYMYNTEGLVVAKIENYTGTDTTFPLITGNVDNTNCALQTQYPDAFVTVYQYNLNTNEVTKITDANCRNTYYDYDDLHRLKLIKDHDGNIVKEFDQQYKPQN